MNRIVLIILLLISFSCNTERLSKNVRESNVLEYYFIRGNVTEMISKAIEQFPKEDIFIILGYEEKFYKVSIVPTKNLKQTILFSMRIDQTNRRTNIKGKNYYILSLVFLKIC
jgi:lipoprotein